jgi:hypothetical protein
MQERGINRFVPNLCSLYGVCFITSYNFRREETSNSVTNAGNISPDSRLEIRAILYFSFYVLPNVSLLMT